jgi:uncharacterized protein YceH (UPF0502 family)
MIEKDLATPDYYPLSLNALTNACNQKTNREPVVAFDDVTVRGSLEALRDGGWAVFVQESGSRVLKFRHRLSERFNLSRGELAVLAVLLLRGPQTLGELRGRAGSMHGFDDLDSVQFVLDKLAAHEPIGLAMLMPRVPGTKEPRWCHLLAPAPETPQAAVSGMAHVIPSQGDRLSQLEEIVKTLVDRVDTIRKDLDELRSALL